MKALGILQEGLDFMNKAIEANPNSVKELQSEIDIYNEAIKEFEELNSVLIDLFTCIEFTEDENAEKRLSSMETYLRRLARFKSE